MGERLARVLTQWIILTAIVCAGCSSDVDTGQADRESAGTATVDPANAEYSGIYDHSITLIDGRYEGPPFVEGGASRPAVKLVDGFRVDGDFDADGIPEAVVILTENSGGSGQFIYLAVLGQRDGATRNLGTALAGDRLQIKGMQAVDTSILLDVVQSGPDDPLCCPTQNATLAWSFTNGELKKASETITDTT